MDSPKEVTLANLAECSAQEVANHIVFRLAGQGFKQSRHADRAESCAYRGAEGRACAAGHCMTDEEYKALCTSDAKGTIEGRPWQSLTGHNGAPGQHRRLIREFQRAHDMGIDPGCMIQQLRRAMQEHGVSTALLDSITSRPAPSAAS